MPVDLVPVQGLLVLRGAAERLATATTIEQVTTVALELGGEAVGATGATIALRGSVGDTLTLTSTQGYNDRLVKTFAELPLSAELPICHTARTGEPLLLVDRESAARRFPDIALHQALTDEDGTRIVAAIVQALPSAGGPLGSLALTWEDERDFSAGDVELTGALATLVAQAFTRVHESRALDAALSRATLLGKASELLVAGLDRDAVLRTLVDVIQPALADYTTVDLLLDDGPAERVVDTRPPEVAVMLAGLEPGSETGLGFRITRVPLRARLRALGTLTTVRRIDDHTAESADLLRAVASRAALALDHARLFAEQRSTSLTLQRALLTPPPEPGHLHIAVRYLPATHAAIGGDWYDAFVVPDGRTMVVIGDVVGHDAQAAASMGQLRAILRTLAYADGGSPASILTRTEDTAAGLGVGALATAVVATIDGPTAAGEEQLLHWANAGHPPPVHIRASGDVTLLRREPELMLGASSAPPARTGHRLTLSRGDTVVLYTDGLVERRGGDLDEDLARLVRACTALAALEPDELCEALIELLLPDGADDDVALVVVRSSS